MTRLLADSNGAVRRRAPPAVKPLLSRLRAGLGRGLCLALGVVAWRANVAALADVARDAPLVLTQAPREAKADANLWDAKGLVRADWFAGARIVTVSPEGQTHILSEGFQSACDPNVSFDATHLLFAAKKDRQSHWRIYEIGLDGQGLRPVTPEGQDARSPIYLSTLFTLDSPEPWFTLAYVARENTLNELGRPSASSLYNIKLDGTEVRRLTHTPNHNLDPFQMWDGRVIYAAEQYPIEADGGRARVRLFGIHIEGADMELFGGEQGRRIQHMPCATEKGLVVFVESDQATWDGAGQLACVRESRPHVTYQRLTEDPAWLYLHPSPWRGNVVLVSRRPAEGQGTCGVFAFDPDQRRCELVFDSPDYHDVQAQLVKARNRPDGHSTVVNTKTNTGTFYGLDCYDADERMRPHLSKGIIKRVRFIEGVLPPAESTPSSGLHGPVVPRRLIGEAPVEADGSFNVEVPASTPIQLQTLDERGLALATCGWIWVQPKETRGCIGCHEDPERVPENEYVLALRRPSNRLVLPPPQRRSVSFREDIAPLVRKHCAAVECHGGKDTPLPLRLTGNMPSGSELEESYAALLAPTGGEAKKPQRWPSTGRYVDAGRARTSWLTWQLTGQDTSRPWDHAEKASNATPRMVKQMPPPGNGSPLREEELLTFIQWIDMGAQLEAVRPPESPAAAQQTQPR
jgi:hypothetical protein